MPMFPAFYTPSNGSNGSPVLKKAWENNAEENNDFRYESGIVYGRPKILLDAVTKGRLRQLRLLLDAGINVNSKEKSTGQTALIRSVFLENPKLRRISMKMLINYGAKVKIQDNMGRTALSWACLLGREDALRLFQSNPELDLAYGSLDTEGNTNLILACMSGNAKIVTSIARCFRRNRLDVNRTNSEGESALSLVKKLGNRSLVEILLDVAHVNSSHLPPERASLTAFGFGRCTPKPRVSKPRTAPAKKSCNLPKLFNLYTEQLTHSYPTRNCKSGAH